MSIVGSEQWMYSSGREFYEFPIEQSLRFNDNDSAYLSRTPASAGNRKTWTWSGWIKKSFSSTTDTVLFSANNGGNQWFLIGFSGGNTGIDVDWYNGSTRLARKFSNANFRDVSAWYNVVVAVDTTDGTAEDRIKVYINGVRVTSWSINTNPSQNSDTYINSTNLHTVGENASTSQSNYFDGYLADVNFIDGQQLDATSFGELKSGIWIPKDTSGLTFGTNGFRLQFGDSAAIGDDTSGNTNDWTVNNLVASDVVLDAPTNNFATHNPLASLGGMTFTEGNLEVRHADIAAYNHARSTMGMTSGKWYWEWYNSGSSGDAPALLSGIVNDNVPISTSNGYVGQNTNSYGYNVTGGARYYNGSNIGTISVPTGDSSGVYMVAYDADNGDLYFGANGTWANSGNPATGTGALFTGIDTDRTWFPAGYTINNDAGRWREVVVNHGQDSTFANNTTAGGNADANGYGDFKYAPPSGFLSLCSANLPTGAIDTLNDETPEDYFNTLLWTGDGSNPRTLSGLDFAPDLIWHKSRSAASMDSHAIQDSVRGFDLNNNLYTNLTASETDYPNRGVINSVNSTGFTFNENASDYSTADGLNQSGVSFVSWNWKAGGTGVSNTDGSITSTVSVGATSQQNWFSVVGYTGNGSAGATVGHGLGATPELILLKDRSGTDSWRVYSSTTGETKSLYLNLTNAAATDSTIWNNTAPTSSVFTIGNDSGVNTNTNNYIAYCFTNAEGLCKVGSYTGNGSADGTFVYTGHKPSLVMVKRTDASNSSTGWFMWDGDIDTDNVIFNYLRAESSAAEVTSFEMADFLSNGFKIRRTGSAVNESGGSYIFLSIAEQPFKYANAR
jgi:hypothetical protein